MEEWIRNTFPYLPRCFDNEDGTRSDAFSFSYEQNEDGTTRTILVKASIPRFVSIFGSVPVPPTASALRAVDPDDTMGWHKYFDIWVAQGIIQP